MTQQTRHIDILPIWLRPERPEAGLFSALMLEPGEGHVLVHEDNYADLVEQISEIGRPEFMVFDLPSEARAAALALDGRDERGPRAQQTHVGRTPNGEGVLMVLTDNVIDDDEADFQIHDLRTKTGYLLPLYGSWELQGCEADAALAQPQADRVDLAAVLVQKISEVANPNVLRAIQNELERLPGANVGMPALSLEDLEQDIEVDADLDQAALQREMIGYSRELDSSDPIDALVRRLRDRFPGQVHQKFHDLDEPGM